MNSNHGFKEMICPNCDKRYSSKNNPRVCPRCSFALFVRESHMEKTIEEKEIYG